MHHHDFPDLVRVLDLLTSRVTEVLGDALVGVYLTGSFALGDGDADSDADFLVVTTGPLDPDTVDAIGRLHAELHTDPSHWAERLEGSYIPRDALASPPASRGLLYLDNGADTLEPSDHDDSWVERFLMRRHAITLTGPPAHTLLPEVDPDDLRAEVLEVARSWGGDLLADTGRTWSMWYQLFTAVSFARILHTADTGAVHSKPAGVAWAKTNLAPEWSALVDEAWGEREDQYTKVRVRAPDDLVARTRAFIRAALGGEAVKTPR